MQRMRELSLGYHSRVLQSFGLSLTSPWDLEFMALWTVGSQPPLFCGYLENGCYFIHHNICCFCEQFLEQNTHDFDTQIMTARGSPSSKVD